MIYVVTGNANKLPELRQIFPDYIELEVKKLDFDEIQSLDLHEIVQC